MSIITAATPAERYADALGRHGPVSFEYLSQGDLTPRAEEVLEALPAHTRPIVQDVIDIDTQFHGIHLGILERRAAAKEACDEADRAVRRHVRAVQSGEIPERPEYRAKIERRHDKAKALLAKTWEESKTYRPAGIIGFDKVAEWADKSRGYFAARIVTPKLAKGQTAAQALKSCISDRDALVQERRSIDLAPLSFAEAWGRVKLDAERLIAKGTPILSNTFKMKIFSVGGRKRQGGVVWPCEHIPTPRAELEGLHPIIDGAALAAWIDGEKLLERLEAELRKLCPDNGVPLAARAPRLAEIDAALAELEFTESALVRAAREDGAKVFYRYDMAIPALLQIEPDNEFEASADNDNADDDFERQERIRKMERPIYPRKTTVVTG